MKEETLLNLFPLMLLFLFGLVMVVGISEWKQSELGNDRTSLSKETQPVKAAFQQKQYGIRRKPERREQYYKN